jgi:hypothetical protein
VADELASIGYQPAQDTYNAAFFLCCCMTLADLAGRLGDAKRRFPAQSYTERALALL